jgi:hypothetical protein
MKKIILIGCKGILGKFYLKELYKLSKILVAADIKITSIKAKNAICNPHYTQTKIQKGEFLLAFFYACHKNLQ